MDDDQGKLGPKQGGAAPSAKALREAKLAQALRDNLRRRKGASGRKPAEPLSAFDTEGDKD